MDGVMYVPTNVLDLSVDALEAAKWPQTVQHLVEEQHLGNSHPALIKTELLISIRESFIGIKNWYTFLFEYQFFIFVHMRLYNEHKEFLPNKIKNE